MSAAYNPAPPIPSNRRRYRLLLVVSIAITAVLAGTVGVEVVGARAVVKVTAPLTVLLGHVQRSQGQASALSEAHTGDEVAGGDVVATSAASYAALTYSSGSVTRLGPDTTVVVPNLGYTQKKEPLVDLYQQRGRTWHSVSQLLGGSRYKVSGPNGTAVLVRGTVFEVVIEGSANATVVRIDSFAGSVDVSAKNATVTVPSGQSSSVPVNAAPTPPTPIPAADLGNPFTVLNQALDSTRGTVTSIHGGTSSTGQPTGPISTTADGRHDVQFTLSWPGSTFELAVSDPLGKQFNRRRSSQGPIVIRAPRAQPGDWSYVVTDVQSQPGEPWWVVVSVSAPPPPVMIGGSPAFRILGTVTDQATGAPIEGVEVVAWPFGTPPTAAPTSSVGTDADGNYDLPLPAGKWEIVYQQPPSSAHYVHAWWHGKPNSASADPLTVAGDMGGIDMTLVRSFALTGRVTDSVTGQGLANIGVSAYLDGQVGSTDYGVTTDAQGNYSLELPPGSYLLGFFPRDRSSRYIGHFYQVLYNKPSSASPLINVTKPMVADQAMIAGYFVSGTVTSAASGASLGGTGIGFHVTSGTPSAATAVAGGLTAADGTYRILVPPGSWRVGFFPNGSGSPYVGLWWHDHRDGTGYDLLDVHSDLTGISEALPSI